MSGWVVPQAAGVQLPAGIAVAGMGRRTGAWILDGILSGVLVLIPTILAIAAGAVSLNQQALDQIDTEAYRPFANVTAPIINVQTGPLIFAAVAYVAIYLVYHAGCWVAFAGSPGQRMLGLQVADLESGNNLTVTDAITRWLALYGLTVLLGAFSLVLMVQSLSTIPGRDLFEGGNVFGSTNALATVISWAGTLWSIVLLISAGSRPDHRGFHDRWSGSIVVGKAQLAPATYWPAQGGWPAGGGPGSPYPPQGTPYWTPQAGWQGPGGPAGPYPPQGTPYWPPQAGYPPQGGPAGPYPPQGIPYWPPEGAPTYPGYPGYPNAPQAPQADPTQGVPPAVPPSSPPEPPAGASES